MKKYKNFLNEIHYEDKYPAGFHDFMKKWRKYKNNGDYYVQFTNEKNDVLDRTAKMDGTGHSDPSGNYGYPLKYIIDYPMDIWYGANSKHLRVLKNTTRYRKILHLNEIKDRDDCISYLSEIFPIRISEIEVMMSKARKIHKWRIGGNTTWAKTFFQCVQVDYDKPNGNDSFSFRNSKEQTKIITKKWDTIIDESRSINTAIINDREPNQIIFLNRKGFTVEEIFNLSDNYNTNKQVVTKAYSDTLGRKWSAKILNKLDGDKIKENSKDIYYSVAGRQIILDFHQPDTSYRDNIKMGQKRHKAHKKYDDYAVKVHIITEYGNIISKLYPDDKLTDLLEDIEYKWEEIKKGEKISDYQLRTIKKAEEEEKKSNDEYYEKMRIEEENELRGKFKEWTKVFTFWITHFKSEFKLSDDFEEMKPFIKRVSELSSQIPWTMNEKSASAKMDNIIKDINIGDHDEETADIMLSIYFSNKTTRKQANSFYKLYKKILKLYYQEGSSYSTYYFLMSATKDKDGKISVNT